MSACVAERTVVSRPADREADRLRRHFQIECELADRLRRADKEQRKTLYREVYDELFRRVELTGNAEAQSAQVGLLLTLLEPFLTGATTFLEIGAGSCELSLELARRLERVWAVDAVDPECENPPAGFTFVPSDALDVGVPAGSADVAMSCHLVEHLHPDDLQDHLAEVLGKLKAGGAYVVITPNRLYGPHDISRNFSRIPLGFHLREYTHLELADEMRRAGLALVQVITRLGELPGSTGWGRVSLAERMLGALPFVVRRRLLERAPRSAPFRPLEQVKLVGFKAEVG